MTIAYVAQKFPSLTITFIYREIEALRARGIKTDAFSTWKPRREELSQEAIDLIATTFYVFPLNWPASSWRKAKNFSSPKIWRSM